MIEIVLSICLALGFIGLLIYFYFHEKEERVYKTKIQTDLTNLPIELQKFYAEISKRDTERTQKMIGDTFKMYLKHIEKLERMTLPKPVTEKDVKAVMSRIGTLADETQEMKWDNEIEKAEKGVELPKDEWTGYITGETKVAFEDGPEPTVVV